MQTPSLLARCADGQPCSPRPRPDSLDLLWGAGLIGLIIGLVIYLAVLALMLWIGYLIIKAAVRNGLREHTMWLESRRGPLR